jgi:hypothetical protein
MALSDYPSWELQPRKLTPEQIADPMQVIHDFFSTGHLPQIREMLWELLKTTIIGDYCASLSCREREDLIYFYEQLEKVVEAIHILHKNNPEAG